MISVNGGLPAHRYTTQVTQKWPGGSEPASQVYSLAGPLCMLLSSDRHPAFGVKYRGIASMMIYGMCHTCQVSGIAMRSLS